MSEKLYTEAEAMLMADRAAMNQKMSEMAHRIESTERATKEGFGEIKIQLNSMTTAMEGTKSSLKVELAKEFATKLEVQELAHKVDTMWVRITVAVSTVIAAGMFLQYVLITTDKVRSVLGAG